MLILFTSVGLPIVLLLTVTLDPPETAIPVKPVAIKSELPYISIPEIILLLILIVPVPGPVRMPIIEPFVVVVVILIALFTVVDPIMFGVTVPAFTLPFAILSINMLLPEKPPVISKLVMVLF